MDLITKLNNKFAEMVFSRQELIDGGVVDESEIDFLLENGIIEEVSFNQFRLSLKGLDATEGLFRSGIKPIK